MGRGREKLSGRGRGGQSAARIAGLAAREDDDDDVLPLGLEVASAEVDPRQVAARAEAFDVPVGPRRIALSYDGSGGDRLDGWTATRVAGVSREAVVRLLESGRVKVDGVRTLKSHKLEPGQVVELDIPAPTKSQVAAEKIELEVPFEDAHLLVLVKPRGMLTHPVGRQVTGTLVNALLGHCKKLSGIGGVERPGIVHRLDRETSGLMVVAKSDAAHQALSEQFRDRTVEKVYLALAHGKFEHTEGRVEAPIGRDPKTHERRRIDPQRGRPAVSEYRVMQRYGSSSTGVVSLVEVKLLTGRTHQIRLHLQYLGHPIVGDHLYGRRADAKLFRGTALHSHRLGFAHPKTKKRIQLVSELPADMKELIEKLS